MTDGALLAHIGKLPHSKANLKQLLRELGSKGVGKTEILNALGRLERSGQIIEVRSGQYLLSANSRDYAVGRISIHRDGFGFLIPDKPIQGLRGDIFLPPDALEEVMHGDRALVRIGRIDSDGKADGEIIRILERAHRTVVGEFRITRRGYFVVPHDARLRHWVEIPDGLEIPPRHESKDRVGVKAIKVDSAADLEGMIVDAELLEFPESGDNPVGRVIEVLGSPDDFGVDVEIVIRKHHLATSSIRMCSTRPGKFRH
jgi:ribonuclease R